MPSARTRRGGGSAAAEPPPHPANSWRKKPGSTSRGDWPRRCRKKTASKIRNGNLWHRTWPRGLLADVVARAAYPPSRHACWCVAMGRALSLPHPGGRRPLATNPPNTLSTSTGDGPRRRSRKPRWRRSFRAPRSPPCRAALGQTGYTTPPPTPRPRAPTATTTATSLPAATTTCSVVGAQWKKSHVRSCRSSPSTISTHSPAPTRKPSCASRGGYIDIG